MSNAASDAHSTTEPTESAKWSEIVPESEWAVYKVGIEAVRAIGVPFMLGGAFGLAGYTGRWRNTKDLDFFVHPKDHLRVVDSLLAAGFTDYFPKLAYDRSWIYRATKDDVLVDVIWTTPNHRTEVDELWFKYARPVILRGEHLTVIPAEELLWIKLYVMQKDRCDWPDVINLLYATGPDLNWTRLVERLDKDLPLLQAALTVFGWVCPDRAAEFPEAVRKKFKIGGTSNENGGALERQRVALLDSRPWYAAFQPEDRPMKL